MDTLIAFGTEEESVSKVAMFWRGAIDQSSLLAWSAAGAGDGSELLLGIDILGIDFLHHGEVKVLRATNTQNLTKVLTKVH